MTKYNVVIKNWKTGQVVTTYKNVTDAERAMIEANHYQRSPSAWDLEATKA